MITGVTVLGCEDLKLWLEFHTLLFLHESSNSYVCGVESLAGQYIKISSSSFHTTLETIRRRM